MNPAPNRARLEELLATRTTQQLTSKERSELETLLAAFPEYERDMFELAAAALHLALVGEPDELPAGLEEKLHLTAVALTPAPPPVHLAKKPAERGRGPSRVAWSGWAVAASLLCVTVWALAIKPPKIEYVEVPKEVVKEVPTEVIKEVIVYKDLPPEVAQARIKEQPDAARFAETKGALAANVVWSKSKQDGVLEVRGLAANDPNKEQYQLWVFDNARGPDPKPISVGVFDVKPDGATLVRLKVPLEIDDALQFAISLEKPGGREAPTQVVTGIPKAG